MCDAGDLGAAQKLGPAGAGAASRPPRLSGGPAEINESADSRGTPRVELGAVLAEHAARRALRQWGPGFEPWVVGRGGFVAESPEYRSIASACVAAARRAGAAPPAREGQELAHCMTPTTVKRYALPKPLVATVVAEPAKVPAPLKDVMPKQAPKASTPKPAAPKPLSPKPPPRKQEASSWACRCRLVVGGLLLVVGVLGAVLSARAAVGGVATEVVPVAHTVELPVGIELLPKRPPGTTERLAAAAVQLGTVREVVMAGSTPPVRRPDERTGRLIAGAIAAMAPRRVGLRKAACGLSRDYHSAAKPRGMSWWPSAVSVLAGLATGDGVWLRRAALTTVLTGALAIVPTVFDYNWELDAAATSWMTNASAAEAEHGHISGWDVSRVTSMHQLFHSSMCSSAPIFNAEIGGWNTAAVTNMKEMFFCAKYFNADLQDWDVSKVGRAGKLLRHRSVPGSKCVDRVKCTVYSTTLLTLTAAS